MVAEAESPLCSLSSRGRQSAVFGVAKARARGRSGRSKRTWSLARRLFVLQVVVVTVVVLVGATMAWFDAREQNLRSAREEVSVLAETLASTPLLKSALRSSNPSAPLQPWSRRVQRETGVDFVTIMNTRGIRYTHPHPERIGERFWGHIRPAVRGRTFTETYTGTLGPSVRAVAPVFDDSHNRVLGLVSAGIKVRALNRELRGRLVGMSLLAGTALLLGGLATYLVSSRLRRYTHGLSAAELSRMYEYHDAILHAVHEGLLVVSANGVITLCNDGAGTLLGAEPRELEGVRLAEVGLPESLRELLVSREPVRDRIHVTDDRVLLVTLSAVRSKGRDLGDVVVLRDHTELRALSIEVDSLRGFSESLRSQAHESANRLHTVVSLVELGRTDQAVEFATAELRTAQWLTDRVVGAVGESVLGAVLLAKMAQARESGVTVTLTDDTEVDDTVLEEVGRRDLVTILGNLIDNATEALRGTGRSPEPTITVTLRTENGELLLRVADNGEGVRPDSVRRLFQRGFSTKDGERGLGLALVGQSVRRYGGRIDVANEAGAVFTVRIPLRGDRERDTREAGRPV